MYATLIQIVFFHSGRIQIFEKKTQIRNNIYRTYGDISDDPIKGLIVVVLRKGALLCSLVSLD